MQKQIEFYKKNLPERLIPLRNAGYVFIGEKKQAAVKVCYWTRKSIKGQGECYKQAYGIKSSQCVQMTPDAEYCNNNCVYCWREVERFKRKMQEYEDPEVIIEESVKAQKYLLQGLKGSKNAVKEKWLESQQPKHFSISLMGEPTLYPLLPLLVEKINKRFTSFVVSNGLQPNVIEELSSIQPTQMYLSLNAWSEESFVKISNNKNPDAWSSFLESASLLENFKRSVFRMTLARGLNLQKPEKFAEIIEKFQPCFVEVKAWFPLGSSRARMKTSQLPSFFEINSFADELARLTSFERVYVHEQSEVVILARKGMEGRLRF
jgi:tRNA wybutosine-synthesizing protein 1